MVSSALGLGALLPGAGELISGAGQFRSGIGEPASGCERAGPGRGSDALWVCASWGLGRVNRGLGANASRSGCAQVHLWMVKSRLKSAF